MKKTLAERLEERRKAKGWGPTRLEEVSGVGRSTLHRIETNPTYEPTTRTLRKLADALGCDTTDLIPSRRSKRADLAPVIDEWLELERRRPMARPTTEEIAWLRGLPDALWDEMPPTPDVLAAVVEIRRKVKR